MGKASCVCVLVASFVAASCSVGCGSKKIDTSSVEAAKGSMEAAKQSMTPEKKAEFDAAVATLMMDGVNLFSGASPDEMQKSAMSKLDGKSPDEIIAAAKAVRKSRSAEQAKMVIQQIKDLEVKRSNAVAAKAVVSGFKVNKSAFYFSKEQFSTGPVVELNVKNETKFAVSEVHFKGVLATPGRSIPWVNATFSYSIPGGLEPGESAEWKLSPNQFGEWGQAPRDRNDMVLTVEVEKLVGPDEAVIADAMFNPDDEKNISELKELLKTIESL